MISRINASTVNTAYREAMKQTQKDASINKQGDMSKIEKLKADIENGAYRVDVSTLAERLADELLSK